MRLLQLILPSIAPAVTAGMLLVFLTAFNELTVSALLWGPNTRTLGVVLFSLDESGLAGEAAALGVSTIMLVLALMLAIERMRRFLPDDVLPWAVPAAPRSEERREAHASNDKAAVPLFTSPRPGKGERSIVQPAA
jgi:iron(III) transport system permease protein